MLKKRRTSQRLRTTRATLALSSALSSALSPTLALALSLTTVVSASGCVSAGAEEQSKAAEAKPLPPPPVISEATTLEQAITAAIDYGGDTLADVKRVLKKRNAGAKAAPLLEERLHAGISSFEHHQLLNAGHLYASLPVPVSPKLFQELLASERPLGRQIGWQLAATKPSPALARVIDAELTRAVAEGEEEEVLIPQMANAVRANHLRSSYTLMRQGLMRKGDEEFAQTMISLDPARASDDFLAYLALAPAEELRQLTMSSVNLYTCMAILHHLQKVPPTVGAANFERLFFYAVSRNTGLAELAQSVIESYVPRRTEYLAQLLAKHPAWVQIAFLENARRRLNPKLGLLLGELKKSTAENDVVTEIDEIKL